MADKIVVLRSGSVEQAGSPLELYNAPVNQFVAGFIGSPRMNFISGQVVEPRAEGALVDVPQLGALHAPAQLPAGAEVTLGIRPEHIRVGGASVNAVNSNVANVEQLGGLSYVRLAPPELTVQLPGQTRLIYGQRAEVNLPPEAIHVFDADGKAVPPLVSASTMAGVPS